MSTFHQTASYSHHAEGMGIELPDTFVLQDFYKLKSKKQRIAYTKSKVPRETIIKHQARIAQELSERYSPNSEHKSGFWGPDKIKGGLIFDQYGPGLYAVSVANTNRVHTLKCLLTIT